MIKLDLNKASILPEKMSRRCAPRRQVYAIALTKETNEEILTFHETFAAFSTSSIYRHLPTLVAVAPISASKFHRDSLSSKPKHFCQLIKHSHEVGFYLVIQIEIISLMNKDT